MKNNTRNGFLMPKIYKIEVLHHPVWEIIKKLDFRYALRRPFWIFVDNSKTHDGISCDFFSGNKDLVPSICAKFQL